MSFTLTAGTGWVEPASNRGMIKRTAPPPVRRTIRRSMREWALLWRGIGPEYMLGHFNKAYCLEMAKLARKASQILE